MPKRRHGLGHVQKSHSKKTAKRLAIKAEMLRLRAAKKHK